MCFGQLCKITPKNYKNYIIFYLKPQNLVCIWHMYTVTQAWPKIFME